MDNFVDVRLRLEDGSEDKQSEIRRILFELRDLGFDGSELRDGVQIYVTETNVTQLAVALNKYGVNGDDVDCSRLAAAHREPAEKLVEALNGSPQERRPARDVKILR